jgi:hypothetical protein
MNIQNNIETNRLWWFGYSVRMKSHLIPKRGLERERKVKITIEIKMIEWERMWSGEEERNEALYLDMWQNRIQWNVLCNCWPP